MPVSYTHLVQGIRGYCSGQSHVVSTAEELAAILQRENRPETPTVMVVQTTFQVDMWEKCAKIAKKLCTNLKIFDTICNATSERQAEAVQIAKQSDLMIVIGGKHSSNTKKLYDVCRAHTRTCLLYTSRCV